MTTDRNVQLFASERSSSSW